MEKPESRSFLKCNGIGKIWYGMMVILLQIFVHYDEIETYMDFKKQSNDPRYGLQWNEKAGTFSLMMTMVSLATLPFFLYSSIVRTGNLVNDYLRLGGIDLVRFLSPRSLILERLEKAIRRTPQPSCWSILKYYTIPSCQALHFVSAFLLLVPHSLLNAEKIKNSALSIDYLSISDLHIIFSIKDPGTLTIVRRESEALRFPIASINFIVSFLFLSIYTSTVFWKTSKSFSFLIAIFDVVMSLCFMVLNSTLSVAMKYSSKFQEIPESSKLYTNWECEIMLIVAFVLFLICRNLVFEFGLQRYMVNQRSFHQMLEEIKVPSISTGLLRNSREFKDRIKNQLQSFWLNGVGFLFWFIEACCLIPLACYLVTIYWSTTNLFFILGFISITCILVSWFSMWMLLSIKYNWIFKVESHIHVRRDENQPPEPIYTCFHENKALSNCSFNGETKHDLSKMDNGNESYFEDSKWGKSDLYQLFKLPPDYNSGRIPSVTSIPSHFGNEQIHPTYQTMQTPKNSGSLLNGIDENRLLDNRNGHVISPYGDQVVSPLMKVHNHGGLMSQRNLMFLSNSQADSAYQSCKIKNYSQDSLRSVTFAHRRKNLYELNDFGRGEHLQQGTFETTSHNDIYPTKENMLDDNTDISTDFSDQNTNSSGPDIKINHKSKYFPASYHQENHKTMSRNDEIYLQQTGV